MQPLQWVEVQDTEDLTYSTVKNTFSYFAEHLLKILGYMYSKVYSIIFI